MNPMKVWLRTMLGDKCQRCGKTEFLQFDLIKSDGGHHHHLNYYARLCFYVGQFQAHNLQLLCPPCHTWKTLRDLAEKYSDLPPNCPHCGKTLRSVKNRGGTGAEPPPQPQVLPSPLT